jgi:rhodanese-related sulfurtransferase
MPTIHFSGAVMDTRTILYVAIAAVVAFIIIQRIRAKNAASSVVSEKIRSGAKIIDVRTPQEFAGSSYPKAKNIPVGVLPSRMADLPKDKPIVLYCASGARSAQAARILKRAGLTDVINAGSLGRLPR